MPLIDYTYDNVNIKYVIETNAQMIMGLCVSCRRLTFTRLYYQFPLQEDYADFSMAYCIPCAELTILMELLEVQYYHGG